MHGKACVDRTALSNGPYKKDSTTRQGTQKGANFCATLLLLYHTSDWLKSLNSTKPSGSCIYTYP